MNDSAPDNNKPLQLVVFDWDGTLMDSEARIVSCLRAAGAELGLPALDDGVLRNVIGLGLKEAIETLHPEAGPEGWRAFADRYRNNFLASDGAASPLFDGALELLTRLQRRGVLLAIATGKSRRGLDRALTEQGCARLFHATRCADETFSKPHPQMLLELMEELGVTPDETLMVGDTEYDLQMARSAGVAAVGVAYGVHAPQRLLACSPLACVGDIAELTAWLEHYIMMRHDANVHPETPAVLS